MKKILVIDDDERLREMIRLVLSREGYDVFEASNGEAGLRWLENNRVDLVLTDVLMPQADGLQVLLAIRKRFPELPSIAMSAGGQDTAISLDYCMGIMKAAGCRRFMSKPFNPPDLIKVVSEVVRSVQPVG